MVSWLFVDISTVTDLAVTCLVGLGRYAHTLPGLLHDGCLSVALFPNVSQVGRCSGEHDEEAAGR